MIRPLPQRRELWTGFALACLMAVGNVVLHAQDLDDEASGADIDLEQLGNGLKAAVITGQMDEKEAWEIWYTAAEAAGSEKDEEEWGDPDNLENNEDPKAFMGRLVPPDPADPARLVEPEFFPRDGQFLINRLELGRDQAAIVEVIIDEYLDSFEVIATPLPIAVERYQALENQRELEERMSLFDRGEINPDEVQLNAALELLSERVRDYAEESVAKEEESPSPETQARAAARAERWTESLGQGLVQLDDRLEVVRRRMQARLAEVSAAGQDITADDLINLAGTLRRQREGLRRDVEEMLHMILVIQDIEVEQAALNEALAEIRLRHALRHARLGGEFINPWSVVADTYPQQIPDPVAVDALRAQVPELSRLIQTRTEAAIDREIAGLELIKVRDDLVARYGDESNVAIERWVEVVEPFARAWENQIDASVSYRDDLLLLMETIAATIAVNDADAATRFRDGTWRRGFGPETRTRWSERAIQTALRLEDLDQETLVVLAAIQEEIADDLRRLRAEAIRQRMERDVELAKAPVLALWGFVPEDQSPWRKSDYLGQEHEAFIERDAETELTLQLILTASQFDRLPPRNVRGKDNESRGDRKRSKDQTAGQGQRTKNAKGKPSRRGNQRQK